MTVYIIRRVLYAIPLLVLMTVITFTMVELAPGEFIDTLVPPDAAYDVSMDPQAREVLRERYGYNDPPHVRYVIWLRELVLHHNLGTDPITGQPVFMEMITRWPSSLQLQVIALVVHVVVGTALGVLAARRQYGVLDHIMTAFSVIWISVPVFVFSIFVLYLFALVVPVFPVGHDKPVGVDDPNILQRLHYMALPVFVLSMSGIAGVQRLMRATVLEVLNADYVRTARAKGLVERSVLIGHVLRNASLALVTGVVLGLPGLLTGSFIVEYIFSWPGIGSYTLAATLGSNYQVVLGSLILNGGLVLLASLLADIAIGFVDPRITIMRGARA